MYDPHLTRFCIQPQETICLKYYLSHQVSHQSCLTINIKILPFNNYYNIPYIVALNFNYHQNWLVSIQNITKYTSLEIHILPQFFSRQLIIHPQSTILNILFGQPKSSFVICWRYVVIIWLMETTGQWYRYYLSDAGYIVPLSQALLCMRNKCIIIYKMLMLYDRHRSA